MSRHQTTAGLLCFSLLAASLAAAKFVVETHSLRIREPATMTGEFSLAIGDFGVPLYGASMLGQIVYPAGNKNGCEAFPKQLEGQDPALPIVLLVARGDCYFIEKAYNAERAGAQAVIVMDNIQEQLLTMSNPEERPEIAKLKADVTIPTALIQKATGETILAELLKPEPANVIVELDWTDSITHPDEHVEWELWTSSNDGCGAACSSQASFKRGFANTAALLEKGNFTSFAPHFMHRRCLDRPEVCAVACIHQGRYCAFDSIGDAFAGSFQPRQVVIEDKRQLCVAKVARSMAKPWLWWTFAGEYSRLCTMANGRFGSEECAQQVALATGIDGPSIVDCMGDSEADAPHDLLQVDLDAQGAKSEPSHATVLLLPTVVINTHQYRGRLDVPSITRALCAGFSEAAEPDMCLSGSLQEDDCTGQEHGCWQSGSWNACVDTFRGHTCRCPAGFSGDGHSCQDIDECAAGTSGCDQGNCTNTMGGWECGCPLGFLMIGGHSMPSACMPQDACSSSSPGQLSNGGCEMACTSHSGQAACSCPLEGLQLASDQRSCQNVNECLSNNGGCQSGCVDKDPRKSGVGYVCTCPPGFAVDPDNSTLCVHQDELLMKLGMGDLFAQASRAGKQVGWLGILLTVAAAAVATLGLGAAIWHYRARHHTQQQIREIMKQYMPLDGSPDEEAPPVFDPKVPLPAIPAHRPEAASSDPPPFEQPAPGPST